MNRQQQDALRVLGYFYLQHQQPDKARVLFRALLTLTPDDNYALRALGYACLKAGHYRDALTAIDRIDSDDALTRLIRSQAHWALGEKEQARTYFEDYLQMQTRR